MANLVLIETAGNQRYIFATNKRRENVGASQLIHEAGVDWVREECEKVPGSRQLTITSGKALVQVSDAASGRRLVAAVTRRALREAPGLDVYGVVGTEIDPASTPLHEAFQAVHRDVEQARSGRPGPELRFLRLPLVDECATSGLPASRLWRDASGEITARSRPSLAKLAAARRGMHRLGALIGVSEEAIGDSIDFLEEGCDWVAVAHADGNGIGALFSTLDQRIPPRDGESVAAYNERYGTTRAGFSRAVADCTVQAVKDAAGAYREMSGRSEANGFLPVVVGGDDVTLLCDGKYGVDVAKAFLDGFEAATGTHPRIAEMSPGGLGACAGIAVVKPHFPFSLAYDLASDLTDSAKRMKRIFPARPFSALDFHVMYDASGGELSRIREKLEFDPAPRERLQLYGTPVVTTTPAPEATVPAGERHWGRLVERAGVLTAKYHPDGSVADPAALPGSQAHDLRAALFSGRSVADSRFHRLLGRYENIGALASGPDTSLFWQETDPDGTVAWVSGLLDAMEYAGLSR